MSSIRWTAAVAALASIAAIVIAGFTDEDSLALMIGLAAITWALLSQLDE
jgi:hypothetical protein